MSKRKYLLLIFSFLILGCFESRLEIALPKDAFFETIAPSVESRDVHVSVDSVSRVLSPKDSKDFSDSQDFQDQMLYQDSYNNWEDYKPLPIIVKIDHTQSTIIKGKFPEGIPFELEIPAFAFGEDVEIKIKTALPIKIHKRLEMFVMPLTSSIDISASTFFGGEIEPTIPVIFRLYLGDAQVAENYEVYLGHSLGENVQEFIPVDKLEKGWVGAKLSRFSPVAIIIAVLNLLKEYGGLYSPYCDFVCIRLLGLTLNSPLVKGEETTIEFDFLIPPNVSATAEVSSDFLNFSVQWNLPFTPNSGGIIVESHSATVKPSKIGRGEIAVSVYNPVDPAGKSFPAIQTIIVDKKPLANMEGLAEKYKPVLLLSSGEKYHPVSIEASMYSNVTEAEWLLEVALIELDPTFLLSLLVQDLPPMLWGPKDKYPIPFVNVPILLTGSNFAENLGNFGLKDFSIIITNKDSKFASDWPAMIYWTAIECSNNGYALQYWFYYHFDSKPVPPHPGDWESVTILLDENKNPYGMIFSQHNGCELKSWDKVEKDPENLERPRVYVARDSHASYPYSVYNVLPLFDTADGKNPINNAELEQLPRLSEVDSYSDFAWLLFSGRFNFLATESIPLIKKGFEALPFDPFLGPRMPPFGPEDKWLEPCDYALSCANLTCKSHAYKQCCFIFNDEADVEVGKDVCWFNNCGQQEEVAEYCDVGCQFDQCFNEPICMSECFAGQKECVDNLSYHICQFAGDCYEWGPSVKCPMNTKCQSGDCICQSNCIGKDCGDDGCQGECGTCGNDYACENYKCKKIIDYCGDGKCESSEDCLNCEKDCGKCLIVCGDKKCESGEDSCSCKSDCAGCCDDLDCPACSGICKEAICDNGNCECIAAKDCCGNNQCEPEVGENYKNCPEDCECAPNCGNKQCGDDGCNGTCGTCQPGYNCENYQCVKEYNPCVNKGCENNDVYCYDSNGQKSLIEDCGNSYVEYGSLKCNNSDDVVKDKTTISKGCSNSACYSNSSVAPEFVENCVCGCTNGKCDSCYDPCETLGCYNNNVYCYDSNGSKTDLFEDCGDDKISYGSPYCKNGNVVKDKTKTIKGCSNGSCYVDTTITQELVANCNDCGCSNGDCKSCCQNECTSGEAECLGVSTDSGTWGLHKYRVCEYKNSCWKWSSAKYCAEDEACLGGDCYFVGPSCGTDDGENNITLSNGNSYSLNCGSNNDKNSACNLEQPNVVLPFNLACSLCLGCQFADCDGVAIYLNGQITTSGDEDWYKLYADDFIVLGGFAPKANISGPSGIRVCIVYSGPSNQISTSCTATKTTVAGLPACCGTNPSYSGGNGSDSGIIYLRVYSISGSLGCDKYTLDFDF